MSLHSKRLIMLNKICGYLISQKYIVTKLDIHMLKKGNEGTFSYYIWADSVNDKRIGNDMCHYEILIDPSFNVHVMLHFEGDESYRENVENIINNNNLDLTKLSEKEIKEINQYYTKRHINKWLWYKLNTFVPIPLGDGSISGCSAETALNQIVQNPSPENTLENIKKNLSDLIDETKQVVERVLGIIN